MALLPFRSLRARMLLLVWLALLPLFAVVAYDSLLQRKESLAAAQRQAQDLAETAALEQELIFGQTREILSSLARAPRLDAGAAKDSCAGVGADLLRRFPYYANFGLIDSDGKVVCSVVPFPGTVSLADRDYFRLARDSQDFALGRYQTGRITGKPTVNAGYPLLDGGQLRYVAYLAIDLSWLNRLLSRVQLPPDSSVALVDHEGSVLAAYPPGTLKPGQSLSEFPRLREAAAHGGGAMNDGMDDARSERVTLVQPLDSAPERSTFLALSMPGQQLYAEAGRKLTQRLVWLSVVLLLVLVAAWFGSDMLILRRLRRLNAAVHHLGRGNLSVRTGLVPTADELGALAGAFDHMAGRLQQQEEQLRRTITDLANVNRALHLLSAGNSTLLHAQEETTLLQAMCRVAVEKGHYLMAWVGYCADDESQAILPMAHAGVAADYLERIRVSWGENEYGQGPIGRAVRAGEPCAVNDTSSDPSFAPWRDAAATMGYRSVVALPLQVDSAVLGVLAIYAREPDVFGAPQLDLLGETAADLAFGIATIRLRAEHEKAQASLVKLAFHDALTDLPNRAALNQRVDELLAVSRHSNLPFALLELDVNRFRDFNDAFGYGEGDLLLRKLGQRLQGAVADGDIVARIGEDEFGILLPGRDASAAQETERALLRRLSEPFEINGLVIDVRTATGIALFPGHGDSADLLFLRANKAVFDAKSKGVDYLLFDGSEDTDCARRLMLVGELRRAMEHPPQLLLYGQPKIDVNTGKVGSAELLMRWQHPVRGMISPGEFIPLAERTGLIKPLTYWALEAGMRHAYAFQQKQLDVAFAVNLSVCNLRDPKLLERIDDLRRTWGVAAGKIQLELTESALMDDPESALQTLRRLHERGFELHIDDFGTGYSSLSYLQKLPVSVIKIDQSFVRDMDSNANSATIVRSTIELAHSLNLKVVAEGVETQVILDRLAALGCDMAQGYYIAKPMPVEQLGEWLSGR